jgi:hypothetical protein
LIERERGRPRPLAARLGFGTLGRASIAAKLVLGYGLLGTVSIVVVSAVFYTGTIGVLDDNPGPPTPACRATARWWRRCGAS